MKELNLKNLILMLVVSLCGTCQAAELKGKISDDAGNPIDYASVRIYRSDSTLITGTVSDEQGLFHVGNLPADEVAVTASSIGYGTASTHIALSDSTVTEIHLTLAPQAAMLQEITVTAERFLRTPNGITVIPDSQQKKHASSGYELLRNLMIPGVTVDAFKGSVTALGGKVSLYIDGMEADEREVRQLRPEEVERVVYIDAPSGRYAGDNTALNFILKKKNSGGYVSLDMLQRIGYTSGDYNLAAKYYRKNTQYTLFAGTDYKNVDGTDITRHEKILFPDQPAVTRLYSTVDNSLSKNTQYGQLRVRNKNDRRTLRATLSIVHDATPRNHNSSILEYFGIPHDDTQITADQTEKSGAMKYSLGLSGTFNLPHNQSIDASASATVSNNSYDYIYSENSTPVTSSTSEDCYNFTANLSYVKNFNHGNSLAVKLTELLNISSSDYSGTHSSHQHLWMSESLGFIEYMQPLGKRASLRLSPGISVQAYRLQGMERVLNFAPRAQIMFSVQPSRGQFAQISGAYGNSYPQLSMLNSATTQVDIIQQKRGNPNLGQTHMLQCVAVYGIGIGKVNLQAMALFMRASSLPMTTYSFDNGMLVQTFAGNGVWNSLTPTLSATWMPNNRFNIQLQAGWLSNEYSGVAELSASCFTTEARVAYYIGDFAINAYATSPQKNAGYDRTITQTIWDFGISGSWSHGNLKVEGGFHNPFLRHPRHVIDLNTPQYLFHCTQYSPADRQSAYLKASYVVDFGKKTKRDAVNVDKTVNSAILRAH